MENNSNSFDIHSTLGYNDSKDAVYERVAARYDVAVDIVKMDEQVPVNDTDCRHETLEPDLNDRIGKAVFHGCSNPKCGVGFYVQN